MNLRDQSAHDTAKLALIMQKTILDPRVVFFLLRMRNELRESPGYEQP